MALRDVIKKAILAGGATRESLLKLTETTEKGLASQFTYMRMMGNCPMKQADGTYKIVSSAEWEAHKGTPGIAVNLTPAQLVEKAEKKSTKAAAAYDVAKTRHEADLKDKMKELKFIKADAELKIAELELGAAEEVFANSPPDAVIEGAEGTEGEEVEEGVEEEVDDSHLE